MWTKKEGAESGPRNKHTNAMSRKTLLGTARGFLVGEEGQRVGAGRGPRKHVALSGDCFRLFPRITSTLSTRNAPTRPHATHRGAA